MLKYQILIKLFVLNCMFMCCVYGDTNLAEVALLHLLFYTTSTWMASPCTQHMNIQFGTSNFINV